MSWGVEYGPYEGGSGYDDATYRESDPSYARFPFAPDALSDESSPLFITNATGAGTISGKEYESDTVPADRVLTAFESDDDSVTIHFHVEADCNAWMPRSVTIYGGSVPVTVERQDWTQVDNGRAWTGTATIDASSSETIYAQAYDGGRSGNVAYTRSADPPIVTDADWGQYNGSFSSGVYPTSVETGLQTAVKSGDTVDIELTLDSDATRITVESYGASGSTQHFDDAYSSGTIVIENVACGSGTGNKVFRVKANRDGGTYGASDDTPTILMDQASHSYSSLHNQVFDPVSNFALKSGQSCTGDVEISNWSGGNDVISYTSSEVSIAADGEYAETKTYIYALGTYRDSGTNVTCTSRRKANGKQDSTTYLIKICNAAASLTMQGATSRLRSRASGGDKTYSLTLLGNYELKDTPACIRQDPEDDGPALGAWSGAQPDKTWTNTITIQEDDTKNTGANYYTWEGISAHTGSGIETTTITTNPNYTVGGFEERDVSFDPYEHYNPIGTMASNKDNLGKLNCEIVGVKELTYVANTDPAADKFTITDDAGDFDADGNYVRCLDVNFINLGLSYTLRISEDV